MKTFLALLLILVPVAIIIYFFDPPLVKQLEHYVYFSVCDDPIQYKVTSVDAKFNISKEEFTNDIAEAAKIWDNAEGKQLFGYDDKANLTISMVYDKRQSLDTQINDLQDQLKQQNQQINPQLEQYKQDVVSFKQKLADLNNKIDYWNSQGGAPPDVYKQLTEEQQNLQAESKRLNAEAQELNQATDQYNGEVGQLHQTVNTFNAAIQQRPEEGLYDPAGNTITIYFNNGHTELIHTLAHELGHALGMEHNSGKDSIMYPQTNDSITPSAQDLSALAYACRQQTIITVFQEKLQIIIDNYNARQKSKG